MHHHRDHEGAQKLYDLIKDVKICMMATIEPDGTLHSRPMYNQEADEAGELWFFTYLQSPKTTEVSKDNHVNLAYANPDKQHYVSVSGRAEIVRDKQKIAEKWTESMRTWFPKAKTIRRSRSSASTPNGASIGTARPARCCTSTAT